VPRGVKVSNNRIKAPVSIFIDDITPITIGEKLTVPMLTDGSITFPRTNAYFRSILIHQ
jgi:hypothetical protein